MRLILDCESNGLLQELTKIHCIAIRDVDSDYNYLLIGDKEIQQGLESLATKGDTLIGHNLFGFDLEAIKKVYRIDLNKTNKIEDTFILSQLFFGDLKDQDFSTFKLPAKFIGSHSLKAWGQRLNCPKDEYEEGWDIFTEKMGKYCLQDTETTKKLYLYLQDIKPDKIVKENCISIEYSIASILARQQAKGVLFDIDNAKELEASLMVEKAKLRQLLQETFKPRVLNLGTIIPKVGSSKFHTKKGAEYTKIAFQEYNPSSRKQTIDRLCTELGWTPEEFTDKGNPELDEEIIESLPFEQIKPLKDFYIVDKRLGQLSNGIKAWLKMVKPDNRIYGGVLQCGTITGRLTHFNPNMSQVPANDKPWGKECRALFKVPEGKIQIGCDADALEARTLGSFLYPFDGGDFIKALLEGKKEEKTDIHSRNAQAYQVDTYDRGRDCSKTLMYASLYGGGDAKRGLILQQFGIDLDDYVPDLDKQCKNLKKWAESKNIDWSDQYIKCFVAGRLANERFGEQLPALPELIADVTKRHEERGYLIGLDGRKLKARKKSSIFNTLNQSAGSILMKKALQIADDELQLKLRVDRDYEFILNVHDEWQLEVLDNSDIIEYIKEVLPNSIKKAGEFFKLKCPMKGNCLIGRNWSECH